MTGQRTMVVTTLLAVLCVLGLVGMLLADGVWDAVCFVAAGLPLLVGVLALWRRRSANTGGTKRSR